MNMHTPISSHASSSSAPLTIDALFAEWKAQHEAIERSASDREFNRRYARLDAIETALLGWTAPSMRLSEIRLWLSLAHSIQKSADHDAVEREDIAYFLRLAPNKDWNERMLIAAIDSLRQAGGQA